VFYDNLPLEFELGRDEYARHAGSPELAVNAIARS
jgi:hypothetical protein